MKSAVARAFQLRWVLDRNADDLQAALVWWDSVNSAELTDDGKATVQFMVGCLLGESGNHGEAIGRLNSAIEIAPTWGSKIQLAKEYLANDQPEMARTIIASLTEHADPLIDFERLAVKAMLAVNDQDETSLRTLIQSMKSLDIQHLFFREQRNGMCASLLEILDREAANWTKPANSGVIMRLLRKIASLCSYFELKPNVFGIGLNINKIAENVAHGGDSQIKGSTTPKLKQ
jgi:hypothetical protein